MFIKLYLIAWLAVGGLATTYPLTALDRVIGSFEEITENIGKLRKKRKKLNFLTLITCD